MGQSHWTRRRRALWSVFGSATLAVALVGITPVAFHAAADGDQLRSEIPPETPVPESSITTAAPAPDASSTTGPDDTTDDGSWTLTPMATGSLEVVTTGDRAADGTATPLANATFEASNAANFAHITGHCVTDALGRCTITNLPTGDYWVREAIAPAPFNRIATISTDSSATAAYVDGPLNVSSNRTTTSRAFVNRRDNPGLPNSCGIRIALLFDLSNSISASELTQMKTAAKDFVAALANTPSQVGVYTFGADAPAYPGATRGMQLVTSAPDNAAVRAFIDGLDRGQGGTNWDAAFRQLPSVAADTVIVLTDGNPTYYVGGGNGSSVTFSTVEHGVTSANGVKATGKKVIALGIGNDVSTLNLQAISGPIVNSDYFVTDFSTLKNQLGAIATQLCGATVNVTKLLDGQPAGNWTFAPASATSGVTFNPTPAITADNGSVRIDVGGIPADGAPVSITETEQPGTAFVSGSCALADGTPIARVANGVATFTVQRQQTIDCTFENATTPALGSLTIEKRSVGGTGTFLFGLTGRPDQSYTTNQAGAFETAATWNALVPGEQYTPSELAAPPGWIVGPMSCIDTATDAPLDLPITLLPGQHIVCRVTNTATGSISVTKVADGAAPDERFAFTLGGNGGPVQLAAGETHTWSDLGAGEYELSETALTGWSLADVDCGDASTTAMENGVSLALAPGQSISCTFTNTVRPVVAGTDASATTAPSATAPPKATPTVAGTQASNPVRGVLPVTGTAVERMLKTGALLLVMGAGLVLITRTRRKRRTA